MTSRQPPRKLEDVVKRVPGKVLAANTARLQQAVARSRGLTRSNALSTARSHAQHHAGSAHGIAPLRLEPYHGFWFLQKPAYVPMRSPPPTAGTATSSAAIDAANVRAWEPGAKVPWSIERYLGDGKMADATFTNGERLSVLFGLARDVSGLIPIGVDLPDAMAMDGKAIAQAGLVARARVEMLVWGHLRRTIRPVDVSNISLVDLVSRAATTSSEHHPQSAAELDAILRDIASDGSTTVDDTVAPHNGGQLMVAVPRNGYYCGHPASLVHITLVRPDVRLMEHIDWPLLAKQCTAPFVEAATASPKGMLSGAIGGSRNRRDLPRPVDADGKAILVGHESDTFGTALKLDVPRTAVNLFTMTVRPAGAGRPEADPFEAAHKHRFGDLLVARPPLADPLSVIMAERRYVV